MGITLFISSFVFIFLIFFFSFKNKDEIFTNLRLAFIKSSLIISVLVVFFTELLSFFNILSSFYIKFLWMFSSTIVLLVLVNYCKKRGLSFKDLQFYNIIIFLKKETLIVKIIIFLISIIILSFFCVALTINNNWDSYTYHLPKVEHWIQNMNVDFYPTNNIRQLYLAPFAEYFILNLKLLSGNALFINFVQFFSWLNCFMLASLIAKSFGLSRRGQLLSLILAFTLPMGILQSTTTQNDLVVSFFIISFVYFGLSLIKSSSILNQNLLFLSLSFGLGILTKSTFYIFAFPFCLMFGIYYLKLFKIKALYILASIILVFFLLNIPFLYRNYIQFGSPLGPQKTSTFYLPNLNERFGIKETLSNGIKNVGLHMALPNNLWNTTVDKIVFEFHKIIHFSINSNDTSWFGIEYKTNFVPHHDSIGNFMHMIILLLSIITLIFIRFKHVTKLVIVYLISFVLGYILFAFLLKWQPWQTRLDLPIFFLAAPFVSYIISLIKWKHINIIIGTALVCITIIFLGVVFIHDPVKPIFGKDSIFLNNNTYVFGYDTAKKIESVLISNDISNVGLILGPDSWEWQYWLASRGRRFESVYFSKDLIITPNFDDNFHYKALIINNILTNVPEVKRLFNNSDDIFEMMVISDKETLVIYKKERDNLIIY